MSTQNPTPLSPFLFGVAFGTVGVMFYFGCLITMATVPRDTAIAFFNSLLHGLDVSSVLRPNILPVEALLGTMSTFTLFWIAGVSIASTYNLLLKGLR